MGPRNCAQDGFSLLEAVVAMTILAAAMMAINQLVITAIDGAHRIAGVSEATLAESNALEALAAVNPTAAPSGAITLGLYRVSWTSTQLYAPRDQSGYPRGIGRYAIALYDMNVQIARDDADITAFHVKQIGYEKVRDPVAEPHLSPGVKEVQ